MVDKYQSVTSEAGISQEVINQFRQEYLAYASSMQVQPALVQRYLATQAASLADAILQGLSQVRFTLPDQVVTRVDRHKAGAELKIPAEYREQMAGRLMDRLTRTDLRTALRQRLLELEQASNPAVALSAGLVRHALVMYMVHDLLPAGRTVRYRALEGDEIPSQPVQEELDLQSAITASSDAVVEEGGADNGRGELLVPFVPAAQRFYLPQWVAFDDEAHLLVNSTNEAEAYIASMQRYLGILHAAVGLAPYMVADDEYQRKRYGILGQLVNQARALAHYEVTEIIRTVQRRAATNDLNRGLSLGLPFFNDQKLSLETYEFEIIPAGRVMFVPAFVVRAAREQQVKVAQDTRLSPSTRRHLLEELRSLEQAFQS